MVCKTKHHSQGRVNCLASPTEYEFAFGITDGNASSTINVSVGGVKLDVLIDSGATHNIIDEDTWMYLKSKGITCTSSAKPPGQQLYTYASTRPLQVKGTFTCDVRAGHGHAIADLFVIKEKGIPLLCKQTAMQLGMLKIGVNIAAVAETSQLLKEQYPEVFIGVSLHIDPEVKPVAQKEKDELAATVTESASADDAAVEETCLHQCLECKESELEIMQGWLSKGQQATEDLEAERQRADQLASQLCKSSDEVGQLLEQAVVSEAALDTLQK